MESLTQRLGELKKLRTWHITNARVWAADPSITTMKPMGEGEIDLLGLREGLYNEREAIRDRLNEKFKERRFVHVKDPDIQSFFSIYGLEFAKYSQNLDDICCEVARRTKNQFEKLGMPSPEEGSTDLTYNFKKGKLEINLEIPPFAEGVLHYLNVIHDNKSVFRSEYWGEDENDMRILLVRNYSPGKWEEKARRLSRYVYR